MATLQNKIDFALIFSVKNANPNGDPLSGNRPRTTSDGLGEVSDVCLKRKLRNRLQEMGCEIFVQSDENSRDGKKSLSERFNDFLLTLSKDEQKDRDIVAARVCEKWLDVRTFGQVFAFKKSGNNAEVSLGLRGPVTIQSAFSVEPVLIESVQITKSVNSETTPDGKKSSDTMGMKHRVSRAVYETYGSISPQLAEKTGFSDADAEAVKAALLSLFEGDESSARPSGSMQVLQLVWFRHSSKAGQHSSAKVHGSVAVERDGTVTVAPLADLQPELLV
ncbi:MAG: type I-C CRISPR-associated protein Cas7/Csd2 [Oscillospiraceae bacterium]|jgi:CRISPR-associated protein Csd2